MQVHSCRNLSNMAEELEFQESPKPADSQARTTFPWQELLESPQQGHPDSRTVKKTSVKASEERRGASRSERDLLERGEGTEPLSNETSLPNLEVADSHKPTNGKPADTPANQTSPPAKEPTQDTRSKPSEQTDRTPPVPRTQSRQEAGKTSRGRTA